MYYDIIIVGGGVLGRTIAHYLKEENLRILIFDPKEKMNGVASLAAGGMLGAYGEITADKISKLDNLETKFRIQSAQLFPDFLASLSSDTNQTFLQAKGTFIIANPDGKDDNKNIAKIAEVLDLYSESYNWVDSEDIPNYNPHQKHTAYKALFIPSELSIDSIELMNSLECSIIGSPNITMINEEVVELIYEKERIIGVRTSENVYYSSLTVLSSGIGTKKLIENEKFENLINSIPTLMSGKGSSLIVSNHGISLEHVIRTPNRDFACGTHIVPKGGSDIYIGATNRIMDTPGTGEGVTLGEIHSLLHSVIHEINTEFRNVNIKKYQFGSRPLTVDKFPIIGKTDLEGLYIATGTYRNGIVMAPLIAKIIKNEILKINNIFNPFSVNERRKHIEIIEKNKVIDAGVRDLISFIQEPTGNLPYNRAKELELFLKPLLEIILINKENPSNGKDVFSNIKNLFDKHPVAEIIPQLYYELQK